MNLFTISVIAIILAMDCFAVSLAAGTTIQFSERLKLALWLAVPFGFFQFMMTLAGWAAGAETISFVSGFDHWAAFLILAVIGGKMIYEGYQEEEDRIRVYDAATILLLSVATSIDALGTGLSLAFLGAHIWLSATLIGLISFIFAVAGVLFGRRLGYHFGRRMEIIGGILLVMIGMRILFLHFP